jgi:hypothetical protein
MAAPAANVPAVNGTYARLVPREVTAWNDRQAMRMPMLFSPTIGAAIKTGYWFLRARCPACRTTGDVDLRRFDWHHSAAVTALIPTLSCRSCRPNAPFAELVCLSKSSVTEDFRWGHSGNKWGNEGAVGPTRAEIPHLDFLLGRRQRKFQPIRRLVRLMTSANLVGWRRKPKRLRSLMCTGDHCARPCAAFV